jgi:hypothetical protein
MRLWRGFTIPLGAAFLAGMLYYSSLILWPEQTQVLYTTDQTTIGLYSTAVGFGGIIMSFISGYLCKRFDIGKYYLLFIVSLATLISGLQALVSKLLNSRKFWPLIWRLGETV